MRKREKSEFDVLGKIEKERLEREWSEYTLAKNSDIAQSTISTWYRKDLQPSVASIEKICHGLGITLSQFFTEQSSEMEASGTLNTEQQELLTLWSLLAPNKRLALLYLLRTFVQNP